MLILSDQVVEVSLLTHYQIMRSKKDYLFKTNSHLNPDIPYSVDK